MYDFLNSKTVLFFAVLAFLGVIVLLLFVPPPSETRSNNIGDARISQSVWIVEVNEKDSIELKLVEHFQLEELEVIIEAARANDSFNAELFPILLAIRKAENGGPGREFGVVHPRAWNTNLRTQAGWAARTIANNKERWLQDDEDKDFLTFLRDRYAPLNADNDPTGLNHNWLPNVQFYVSRFEDILAGYSY